MADFSSLQMLEIRNGFERGIGIKDIDKKFNDSQMGAIREDLNTVKYEKNITHKDSKVVKPEKKRININSIITASKNITGSKKSNEFGIGIGD